MPTQTHILISKPRLADPWPSASVIPPQRMTVVTHAAALLDEAPAVLTQAEQLSVLARVARSLHCGYRS